MEFTDVMSISQVEGVFVKIKGSEHILQYGDYYNNTSNITHTLCIAGHHLILSSRNAKHHNEIMILIRCIDLIERKDNKPAPNGVISGGSLFLKCKDLRIIQIDIVTTIELNKVAQTLENLCSLNDPKLQYAFAYKPNFTILEDGYSIFGPETEFSKLLSTDDWRLSWVNKNYAICQSYPECLVVPKYIDDEILAMSASFRKGGRFPLLSYKHENGAVLMRSSQPMVGPQGKRCKPDEKLLNLLLNTNKKGFIFDLRSAALVTQQKTKGGGTESDSNYPQWRKVSRQMDKISNLQLLDSFTKLMEICNDKDISCDKWLSKMDGCGWLGHIFTALNTACTIAQCLEHDVCPVLVHGTRGLDATLVVCSLVQIILNPDCRTIRGIQALIEREWIQAGYPFTKRHANSCYYMTQSGNGLRKASFSSLTLMQSPPYVSPTFLLFLDCIHQLLEQFPCSFEFTQDLLVMLFENSYYSQFGSFMGNCEKERKELHVFTQTTSLWSYLNTPSMMETIYNPLYEPNQGIIWPSVAPMSLVLWEELYLRWIIDFSEQRVAFEQIARIREKDKELRSKAIKLRKELRDLLKEIKELEASQQIDVGQAMISAETHEELQNMNSPTDPEGVRRGSSSGIMMIHEQWRRTMTPYFFKHHQANGNGNHPRSIQPRIFYNDFD